MGIVPLRAIFSGCHSKFGAKPDASQNTCLPKRAIYVDTNLICHVDTVTY